MQQLSLTVSNILYIRGRWFWSCRSNSHKPQRDIGILREPFETCGKQKLIVALAIIGVAYSINKWINADGSEEEKSCEMVEWSI